MFIYYYFFSIWEGKRPNDFHSLPNTFDRSAPATIYSPLLFFSFIFFPFTYRVPFVIRCIDGAREFIRPLKGTFIANMKCIESSVR